MVFQSRKTSTKITEKNNNIVGGIDRVLEEKEDYNSDDQLI